MSRKINVFDTETTGLLKPSAAGIESQPYITEIYVVQLDEDFHILKELDSYIKIPVPVPDFITKITGISDDDLKDAPTFEELLPDLVDIFEGSTEMVAHNLAFDKAMVGNQCIRADETTFPFPDIQTCTVQKSMSLEQRRINLTRLHELLLGKGFKDAHRAKSDVHALVRCYFEMRARGMCD